MKSQILILFYLSFMLLSSCSKPETTRYYDTGEKKEVLAFEAKGDTTTYLYTGFYRNGQKKSSGKVVKGEKTGIWTEWYSDGAVRWSCDYQRKDDITQKYYRYKFEIEDTVLKVNVPTDIRFNIEGVYSNKITIYVSNGIAANAKNSDLYDFSITPDHPGENKISFLLFSLENGKTITVASFKYKVIE